MNIGSLFSGAGLGELGFTWAGFYHTWFCENDSYSIKILKLRWPNVLIFEDIHKLKINEIPKIDMITAGFPCQSFSKAAHGLNIKEKDLSKELIRICIGIKPKWIVCENVSKEPIKNVSEEFKKQKYKTSIFYVESSKVGADHKRGRWWVCAYPYSYRKFHGPLHAETRYLSKIRRSFRTWKDYSRIFRVSNGGAYRMDRLKCIGNGQDPFITYLIGIKILKHEKINNVRPIDA